MAAPKKPAKRKRKPASKSSVTEATACATCPDCSNGDGIPFCYDGNIITLNDFPKTGGPWSLVIYPNGTHDWVNVGGMPLASQMNGAPAEAPPPSEPKPDQEVM